MVPPQSEHNVQVIHDAFVTSTDAAWRYLLDNGKELAQKHGIAPEELMLGAHTSTYLPFKE